VTDTPHRLADRLLSEGGKTRQYFKDLAPDQWNLVVYSEGASWTVRQILAHIVAAESSMARLVKDILAGGKGTPENFDLDAYNERKVAGLSSAAVDDLLDQYTRLRSEFASLVRQMSIDDLAKTGRHPFLGIASLEEIVKLFYRHNQIHLRDIRRARV
jgi:hypothetical protein